MDEHLSGAYDAALAKIGDEKTALVVRAIIESKNHVAQFEDFTEHLEIENWIKQTLISHMVERVSDSVAVMCNLLGKGFKKDIMPLVDKVTEEAKQSQKLQ